MTRQARRLRGTLRPIARQDARERAYDAGRSPLGAPPWRFWAPGAALPSPWAPAVLQRRAGAFGSVQRAPRTQVVVPGGRGPAPPEASGYEPPAAGRHSPLRLQDRLRRRPSMSEDANPVAWLLFVVNKNIRIVVISFSARHYAPEPIPRRNWRLG